jgi:hypothetical protein
MPAIITVVSTAGAAYDVVQSPGGCGAAAGGVTVSHEHDASIKVNATARTLPL